MNEKKPKSTFEKITQVVIWTMLILTVGSIFLAAYTSIMG